VVDLAGDVTLQTADDFRFLLAFLEAPLDVELGGLMRSHAGKHNAPQGVVGWRSPPGLSGSGGGLTRAAGMGAAAHRCAQAASERNRSGWSPAAMINNAAVFGPTPYMSSRLEACISTSGSSSPSR